MSKTKDELLGLLKSNIKNFNEAREQSNNEPIDLTGADLTGTNLCRANLENITLKDAELNFAYLHSSNLKNAIMTDLAVGRADMTEADLSGADLSGADLTNTILYGANLSGIKGENITLEGAKLREANLSGANLSCGNLSNLDLTGVNIDKANIKGTDFTSSNLSAVLNLETTTYDQTTLFPSDITSLPEGFDPSSAPEAEMIEAEPETSEKEEEPIDGLTFDAPQEYEFIDEPQSSSESGLVIEEEEFHAPDFQPEGASAGTEAGFEDISKLNDFSTPEEFNQIEPGLAIPEDEEDSGIGGLELEGSSDLDDAFSTSFETTETEPDTASIGGITQQDFPIQDETGVMAPSEDLSGGLDLGGPEAESFDTLPAFGEETDSFDTLPAFGEEAEPMVQPPAQEPESLDTLPAFGEETDSFDTLPAFGEEAEPMAQPPAQEPESIDALPAFGEETDSFDNLPAFGEETEPIAQPPAQEPDALPVFGEEADSFDNLPAFGEETETFEGLPAFGEEAEPVFEPMKQSPAQEPESLEGLPAFGEEANSFEPMMQPPTQEPDTFEGLPAFGEEVEPAFEPMEQSPAQEPIKTSFQQPMESVSPPQPIQPTDQDTPVFADSFGQTAQPVAAAISADQLNPIMDLLKDISGKLDKIETEQTEQKEAIELLKEQSKDLKTKSEKINTELVEESISGKLKEATIFTQKLIQKVESKVDIVAQSDPLEHIDNLLAELSESINDEQESIRAKVVDISTVLDSVVSLLEVDSLGEPDIDLTEVTNNLHQMLTNLESNIKEDQDSTAQKIDDLATILEESKLNINTLKEEINEDFSNNIKNIEDTVDNINNTMGTLLEVSQDDTKDSQVFEAFYDFEFRIQLELEKNQNKLSNLEKILETANEKLVSLDEKSAELNNVNGSEETRKLLESLKTQLSEQIQESEEKTGKLNDAVDDMLIQLESLFNLKLENINTEISEINQKLDTITTAKPSNEVLEIQTGLRVVQSDIQSINGNVIEMHDNFNNIQGEVQKSNDQLFSINSNINDLANALESLKEQGQESEVDDELRSVFEHIIVQFNDFSDNTKDSLNKVNKKLNNLEIEVQMSLKDTDKNISKINGMIRKVYKALDNLTDLVTDEQNGVKIQPYTTDMPRTTLQTPRLNNDFDNEY